MTGNRSDVETHYTRSVIGETILAALAVAGKDIEHLTTDDLAPVDEFHSRRRLATVELAALLAPSARDHVLDVGSGIGGPSRYLAATFGCCVTGLDLTAEFCRVAADLARRTGLDSRVDYRQGDATAMPFAAASFDLAWLQNAAMNIAARDRLYGQIHRVLRPKGRFALQDVTAGPGGAPHYPVPWAREPSISFLVPPEETRAQLEAAGFRILVWQDKTDIAIAEGRAERAKAKENPAPPPALGIQLILGADFAAMMKNSVRNLEERRIGLINAVVERVD
ncbi:MAG TPA: class I SAM-dependent methyltransferase [Stellaceae bacterium]|jgi:SAM-dependent methyltransferase|nr:class I SAM-dependent methyltransferase [Stellaceae bacterium]